MGYITNPENNSLIPVWMFSRCDPDETGVVCPTLDAVVDGVTVTMTVSDYVEEQLGYRRENMWSNMACLIALVALFRLLSFYGIVYVRHLNR